MKFFKNLLLKIAGKQMAKKIGLTEGNMDDNKKWYKSKTIWSGLVVVAIGTYELVKQQFFPGWPDVPGWLLTFLGAAGIYSRTTATTKIG